MDRHHVGGEIYQAIYILYQVKGVHPGTIHILNDITDHPPAEVGVHNGNEGILHEYGLDDFIQILHDGDDHGQDDDIKDPHLEICLKKEKASLLRNNILPNF